MHIFSHHHHLFFFLSEVYVKEYKSMYRWCENIRMILGNIKQFRNSSVNCRYYSRSELTEGFGFSLLKLPLV